MRQPVFAFILSTLALTACAPTTGSGAGAGDMQAAAAAPEGRECFFTRNVNGFSAPDDETLYLRVGVKDVYQMQMFAPCPDMDWAQGLAVVSRNGSSVCRGTDATIVAPGPFGQQRCLVRSVKKLTEAEAAALPSGHRP
ncbi:DUF6491 family protein [Phenylobacterium sp.]|uniref:DUF6491 family protein n=1 Tax=Phenylobacterium sp. TaxID=1871053 RepID=UPI00272F3820|nr:DUF6491 family protein [Phenylobacterium sp.]MDP1616420.1 DUF6491 family protein [Phenylobacterium sp.]MDP1986079.1 DUF6491 family protein [Phenylobacterium sp.]